MYNPINNVGVNAFMRWPVIALPVATVVGLFANSIIGLVLAWIASVALATWATHKVFKKQLCDCEGEAKRKGLLDLPKVNWIIEYGTHSGNTRPWDLYSMYGDDESTKQHYASYTSEANALKKKEFLEKTIGAVTGKDKEQ